MLAISSNPVCLSFSVGVHHVKHVLSGLLAVSKLHPSLLAVSSTLDYLQLTFISSNDNTILKRSFGISLRGRPTKGEGEGS